MLGLEAILKKAILNLRSDRLEREEDVKLAVILPILDALDWNPADPGALRPEYPAGPGRVDYALLCHGRPQVFVEAKRRGALDARAKAQLFGYASNNGVPLLILSDGLCWDFYLSMADGVPEERRFDRLELRDEDEVPEYAKALDEWLRKRHVASGEARRGAEKPPRERPFASEGPGGDTASLERPPERTRRAAVRPAGGQGSESDRCRAPTLRCRGIPAKAPGFSPVIGARRAIGGAAARTPRRGRIARNGC